MAQGRCALKQIEIEKLRIIEYPDPRLRKVCKPIEVFDEWLRRLAERMLKLMHESDGVGLAAPQVGIVRRLFVCNVTGDPKDDQVFVNPRLSDFIGQAEGEEGCLSLPEIRVTVRRPMGCTIQACDVNGKPFQFAGEGLHARCWQHESDHLDGRMIIDYMSEADKIANRRNLKYLESKRGGKAVVF
jgi:peptide deformylase